MHTLQDIRTALRQHFALDEYLDLNLIDFIAADRGWLPLKVDETMTISQGLRQYRVIRLADLESLDDRPEQDLSNLKHPFPAWRFNDNIRPDERSDDTRWEFADGYFNDPLIVHEPVVAGAVSGENTFGFKRSKWRVGISTPGIVVVVEIVRGLGRIRDFTRKDIEQYIPDDHSWRYETWDESTRDSIPIFVRMAVECLMNETARVMSHDH